MTEKMQTNQKSAIYDFLKKNGYKIVLGIVFIALIVKMSYSCYGDSISGDEYFSMGFANNTEDFLFLSLGAVEKYGEENWITGEFLHDWISVQEDGRFAIMSIHRNVRDDVHPPLYFMLLNCLSSFFVDEVTLFPGHLINVIAGTVLCALMYLVMRKIFKDKWLALIPPLLWVTSIGGRYTVNYVRMYAPFCALAMLCIYLHILYMEQKQNKIWLNVCLFGCTIVGTLTHYYYYIVQLVLFVVMLAILLYRKQIKKLFFYGMSLLGGELISVAAYPYVINHLLFSERGVQVQENLANNNLDYYRDFLHSFMYTFNEAVYNLHFKEVFVVFLICLVLAVAIHFLVKKQVLSVPQAESAILEKSIFVENTGKHNFLVIAVAALGYFLILFKISYSSRWLYVSPIFPIIGMVTVGLFAFVISKMPIRNYGVFLFIAGIILFGPNIGKAVKEGIELHNDIEKQHEEVVAYSDDCDVLFFYDTWNNLYGNQILEMMEFDQIRAIPVEDMNEMNYQEILESRHDGDNFVFYIPVEVTDYQEKIADVTEKLRACSCQLIREGEEFAIFYVEMQQE